MEEKRDGREKKQTIFGKGETKLWETVGGKFEFARETLLSEDILNGPGEGGPLIKSSLTRSR